MKLKTLIRPLPAEFAFAGFTFPKYVWNIPRGSKQKRLQHHLNPVCGDYYHAPRPEHAGKGVTFYKDSDGPVDLRLQWADEIVNLGHSGWFTDEHGDCDTIRGLIARLPKNRGFLAGWSMGSHMASYLEGYTYDDAEDAARAADGLAEIAAEREREAAAKFRQEEQEREERELAEAGDELETA